MASIAEAGYLHRDLSFGNVRAKHTSGNEIIVKLIDFDLIDGIENLDSEVTAPDRIGTVLFMPIEILGKTEPPAGDSSMRTRRHFGSGYWLPLSVFTKGGL